MVEMLDGEEKKRKQKKQENENKVHKPYFFWFPDVSTAPPNIKILLK